MVDLHRKTNLEIRLIQVTTRPIVLSSVEHAYLLTRIGVGQTGLRGGFS